MTPTELSAKADISVPYASQLISGQREPSRAMALQIFRATGIKFGPIAKLTDDEVRQLQRLEAKAA